MNPDDRKRAEEEGDWAEDAIEEQQRTGHTEKRCRRCGTAYVFVDCGSGYIIHCETLGCFRRTSRGI